MLEIPHLGFHKASFEGLEVEKVRKECPDHTSACQEGGEGLDLWQEAADQLRNPSAALCQHLHKGEVLRCSIFTKVSPAQPIPGYIGRVCCVFSALCCFMRG